MPNPKNFSVPFYLARYPFHPQNIVVVPILKSIREYAAVIRQNRWAVVILLQQLGLQLGKGDS